MSSHQEYWDACLIRTWRNSGTMIDAFKMFESIVGKHPQTLKLLRTPGEHFHTQIRVWVASKLPRIGDWLFKRDASQDTLLLKKLSESKYDTHAETALLPDTEKKALYAENYRNRQRVEFNTTKMANRNRNTDGNVMRGTRTRRAR